jgi:hypothetical protein
MLCDLASGCAKTPYPGSLELKYSSSKGRRNILEAQEQVDWTKFSSRIGQLDSTSSMFFDHTSAQGQKSAKQAFFVDVRSFASKIPSLL